MGNKQTPDWDVLFFFLYFGPITKSTLDDLDEILLLEHTKIHTNWYIEVLEMARKVIGEVDVKCK